MDSDEAKTLAQTALSPEEERQRSRRNRALGLSIFAFVVLVFLVTLLRLGGSVVDRSF